MIEIHNMTDAINYACEAIGADTTGRNMTEAMENLANGLGTTIELPAATAADNDMVLTVVDGEWAKAAVPTVLPAVTEDDNGKILKVVDGAWAVTTA